MRIQKWAMAALIGLAMVTAGCDSKQRNNVDTAPLESSFKSADAGTQSSADKAVAAIKAGNYSSALVELKTLASNAKLTPDQKQAIQDVTSQVEKAVAKVASNVKAEANKAAEDLKKALPK